MQGAPTEKAGFTERKHELSAVSKRCDELYERCLHVLVHGVAPPGIQLSLTRDHEVDVVNLLDESEDGLVLLDLLLH